MDAVQLYFLERSGCDTGFIWNDAKKNIGCFSKTPPGNNGDDEYVPDHSTPPTVWGIISVSGNSGMECMTNFFFFSRKPYKTLISGGLQLATIGKAFVIPRCFVTHVTGTTNLDPPALPAIISGNQDACSMLYVVAHDLLHHWRAYIRKIALLFPFIGM